MIPLLLWASACCGQDAPTWAAIEPVWLDGGSVTVDLAAAVTDDRDDLTFEVADDPDVLTEVDGGAVTFTGQPDWDGSTVIEVTATDRCGASATTTVEVNAGAPATTTDDPERCPVTFAWSSPGEPDRVAVAGSFNDWSVEEDLLTFDGDRWSLEKLLSPGAYGYKLVELSDQAFGAEEVWSCDPDAPFVQCDPGVTGPWDPGFSQDCSPGAASCNSLLVVAPCGGPAVTVDTVDLDRAAGSVTVGASVAAGSGGPVVSAEVSLDGVVVPSSLSADRITAQVDGLSVGRHELVVVATDAGGHRSEEAHVPLWTDSFSWSSGVVYFAFVDRMLNGDVGNDDPTGATATGGDYEGGDFEGLRAMLPYLDDLGVTVLWISNPQDNTDGTFAGGCGATYAGYHAYWPSDPVAVEPRFGTEEELHALVDEAHARGMRVIMDWVGNHVAEDHPYAIEHPDWFHPFADCTAEVDGTKNYDRIPEECWFSPFLPDVDYSRPEPLHRMVDDAIGWAERFELDGFRVDAVKHMSHATAWNLTAAVEQRLEHRGAGSDTELWTVGETFDGYERIRAYVGDGQLDGQFDFPLYYSVRNTFAYGNGRVGDLMAALDTSAGWFGDAPMSTFLGNHDVNRFVTDASGGGELCDGASIRVAAEPTDPWPYQSLRLGFTFLFTNPGLPLVYYGDELGVPGNGDPDNRHPLAWHVDDLAGVSSVEDLADRVDPEQAATVRHVSALANARAVHPALTSGGWIEWWEEADLFAYARSSGGDHALVVLNRSSDSRVLDNGLSFAGLPQGTYRDVLSGRTVTSSGDRLSVPVPARSSVVLVLEP